MSVLFLDREPTLGRGLLWHLSHVCQVWLLCPQRVRDGGDGEGLLEVTLEAEGLLPASVRQLLSSGGSILYLDNWDVKIALLLMCQHVG